MKIDAEMRIRFQKNLFAKTPKIEEKIAKAKQQE